MAESIVVYFKRAQWRDLESALSEIAASGTYPGDWVYPPGGDHDVVAYEYDDILKEFEDARVAQVTQTLGGAPSSILCIEMRGSKGRAAVDSAGSMAIELLRRFDGAIDELCPGPESRIWTLKEIEGGAMKDGKPFLGWRRDRLRS